jgi:hypothetical protein
MSEQTILQPAEAIIPCQQSERRGALRYACTLNTLCQTDSARPEDFWWRGRVRDISHNGIGLLVSRFFPPGTQLVIEPLAKQETFQTQVVRVIRSMRHPSGAWFLGCEFALQASDRPEITPEFIAALQG